LTCGLSAQKPNDGTYTYTIAFAEWDGESLGTTCTIIIKGDSIMAIYNGTGRLSGEKGDIIDHGIIVKHKTGRYIVGRTPSDKNAEEVGGCTGISVIDFKKRIFWIC
jgi:hypothetical protein